MGDCGCGCGRDGSDHDGCGGGCRKLTEVALKAKSYGGSRFSIIVGIFEFDASEEAAADFEYAYVVKSPMKYKLPDGVKSLADVEEDQDVEIAWGVVWASHKACGTPLEAAVAAGKWVSYKRRDLRRGQAEDLRLMLDGWWRRTVDGRWVARCEDCGAVGTEDDICC
jgi:hypothetical protein